MNNILLNKKLSFMEDKLLCPFDGGTVIYKKDFVKCLKCNNIFSVKDDKIFFINPPDNIEENTKSDIYEKWSVWRKLNFDFFKKEISKISVKGNLLDIGAGPTQFRNIFVDFERYVGIDFYPYSFVKVVTDLNKKIPYQNDVFNVVILSNVLEHISNSESLLKESFRVLKRNSKILATIPFLMRIHQAPYDFNRFTIYKLKEIFENAGFSNVIIEPQGNPYEVLEIKFGHFLQYAIGNVYYKNDIINYFFIIFLKITGKILFFFLRFIGIALKKIKSNNDFTIGYSVSAIKK